MTKRGGSGHRPNRKERRRACNPELAHASAEERLCDHIATVRSIVRRYDSLELLGRLFVEHCLCDPTTYEESTAAHNEVWLEYVHSALVATLPSELEWLAPDEACLAQLNEALEGIYLGGVVALILEPVDKPRLEFESLRVKQRLQNLGVRGDSYQEHHWDLVSFVVNAAGALLKRSAGSRPRHSR